MWKEIFFISGGILVLEAQSYSSYSKKKKLTPRIFENFQSIQFLPEQFSEYLLHEVGFTTSHVIAVPRHASKGFQRPIQVWTIYYGQWPLSNIAKHFVTNNYIAFLTHIVGVYFCSPNLNNK